MLFYWHVIQHPQRARKPCFAVQFWFVAVVSHQLPAYFWLKTQRHMECYFLFTDQLREPCRIGSALLCIYKPVNSDIGI
ncbi:MAG: hypothetical protein EAZ11_12255 [Curvibacter sp.]|nr:MAG: hypothetical protein EAZ11_12255 [Curvibacter sp.]